MRRIALGTLVGALGVSASVLAAGTFEGAYIGAGAGARGQNTKLTDPSSNQLDGVGKNNFFGLAEFGYSMNAGDWNLGELR